MAFSRCWWHKHQNPRVYPPRNIEKPAKKIFQQMLFFGQFWPKFRPICCFEVTKIDKKFYFRGRNSAGYLWKKLLFVPRGLMNPFDSQKVFGLSPALFCTPACISAKWTFFQAKNNFSKISKNFLIFFRKKIGFL